MSKAERIKEIKAEIRLAMENISPRLMLDYFEQRIIGQRKELMVIVYISKLEREMQLSVVFDDDTIDSLLEISYTNLGVRRVMNCLRTIAYRAVSDVFYDRIIDDNCCLVIESADKAYLEFAEEETLKTHENPA